MLSTSPVAIARARALLALAAALVFGPAAASAPIVGTVTIRDMAFGSTPVGLRVGDVVEWVNADIFAHTVTTRDSGFDLDLPAGAKGRSTMTRPGVISFYCRYHPGMTGKLTVAR